MKQKFTDTLASVIYLLSAFEDMCREALPRTNVIYDQSLSYETAINALLNRNNFNQLADKDKYDSLFSYSRTILEDSEHGAGKRVKQLRPVVFGEGDEKLQLVPMYGEFDINFLYTAQQMEDVYNFETFYGAKIGFGEKTLVLDLPSIGAFSYFLTYMPLTDIQATTGSPDTTYKMVGGTIRARGVFFVLNGSNNAVAKFRLRLFDKAEPLENSILIDQWTKP